MGSSHEQFLWVVEFYNRQQISEFWRNCWKSSWPHANEMQGTWFKSCAGVAFPSIPEWAWFSPCQEAREKGKKPCNIDPKIPMKILLHCPPTFLSSNPKIPKALLKPFPTTIKATKWPAKEKKRQGIGTIQRGGEKAKSKSQDCYVTFKPKNYLKLCFLGMPELCKLIPVNSSVVS